MSNELSVEGMSIAPGVVETIISIAANEVDGVASVGSFATSSIRSMLAAKPSAAGIEVDVDDDGRLRITIHVEVYYGYVLPEVAANLRQSVADALLVQVGLEAAAVDIFEYALQFPA